MKVPHVEGLATHNGPESCGYVRKGLFEALTGEVRAGLLSRERGVTSGCRRCPQLRKAKSVSSLSQDGIGPRVVKDPAHVLKLRVRNTGGPVLGLGGWLQGPRGES